MITNQILTLLKSDYFEVVWFVFRTNILKLCKIRIFLIFYSIYKFLVSILSSFKMIFSCVHDVTNWDREVLFSKLSRSKVSWSHKNYSSLSVKFSLLFPKIILKVGNNAWKRLPLVIMLLFLVQCSHMIAIFIRYLNVAFKLFRGSFQRYGGYGSRLWNVSTFIRIPKIP